MSTTSPKLQIKPQLIRTAKRVHPVVSTLGRGIQLMFMMFVPLLPVRHCPPTKDPPRLTLILMEPKNLNFDLRMLKTRANSTCTVYFIASYIQSHRRLTYTDTYTQTDPPPPHTHTPKLGWISYAIDSLEKGTICYTLEQGRIQEFEKGGAQHTVFFGPRNSRKSQKSW